MPFELLQGVGADYAYNPMLHGFSQREIQDTIRRMEVLMKDLDALQIRKEREKKRFEDVLVPDMYDGSWFGQDMRKVQMQQAHDRAGWAAMDRVGIEMELPYIEEALETAPDETPPLRHEDYHQRCKNLQERRGEYWRINPEFRNQDDVDAGIGRRVPWQQGAPSPPPRTPTPPPPPPKREWPFPPRRRPVSSPPSTKAGPFTAQQAATPPTPATPARYRPSPDHSTSSSSLGLSSLDSGPLFTPPSEGPAAPDRDLQQLSEVVDEVEALAIQLMRVQSLAHDSVGSPMATSGEQSASPDSPPGLITQEEFDTVQSDNFLTPQVPCQTLSDQSIEDYDWSPGVLDEGTVRSKAFSPEQLGVDEMEIMMQDAVQRQAASEIIDPCQLYDEAFSPEQLDDATIERMLQTPPGPMALLSPTTQEGLQLLAVDTPEQHGSTVPRETQWNQRVQRWEKEEQRQKEEERRRAQSADARHMDAASLFGVRPRGISAPATTTHTRAQRSPETLQWGESPVDHVSPVAAEVPPRWAGKRRVPPKPALMPHPDLDDMPPSRILFPREKSGPTVCQPDRPSTSNTIYNTRKGEYEHLDQWARSPAANLTRNKINEKLGGHQKWYFERLIPGPGVVAPQPAPPPPQPRPEYGPEPEDMSVYIPEHVVESPNTLKQGIHDAIDRFEIKMEKVRQRLELKTKYREQSPWVQEEYMGEARRERERQREREKQIKGEMKRRQKWDTYMLCKFGTVPSPDKYGIMRGMPRTSSTYRPPVFIPPPKKKAPAIKPYDGPVHGPSLPWVYGSNRPPPKTAAGRISSPCEPAPKPVFSLPVETPLAPRAQPSQWLPGSDRTPLTTASRYMYRSLPRTRRHHAPSTPETSYGSARAPRAQPSQGLPGSDRTPLTTASRYRYRSLPWTRRYNHAPSTPETLYGSARAPPKTAASPTPRTPLARPGSQTPLARPRPQAPVACPRPQPPVDCPRPQPRDDCPQTPR